VAGTRHGVAGWCRRVGGPQPSHGQRWWAEGGWRGLDAFCGVEKRFRASVGPPGLAAPAQSWKPGRASLRPGRRSRKTSSRCRARTSHARARARPKHGFGPAELKHGFSTPSRLVGALLWSGMHPANAQRQCKPSAFSTLDLRTAARRQTSKTRISCVGGPQAHQPC